MTKTAQDKRNQRLLIDSVWMRDGGVVHFGPAVSLAMLLHIKGERGSDSEKELRRIFKDPNLED